jgi:hypothetical protein
MLRITRIKFSNLTPLLDDDAAVTARTRNNAHDTRACQRHPLCETANRNLSDTMKLLLIR